MIVKSFRCSFDFVHDRHPVILYALQASLGAILSYSRILPYFTDLANQGRDQTSSASKTPQRDPTCFLTLPNGGLVHGLVSPKIRSARLLVLQAVAVSRLTLIHPRNSVAVEPILARKQPHF